MATNDDGIILDRREELIACMADLCCFTPFSSTCNAIMSSNKKTQVISQYTCHMEATALIYQVWLYNVTEVIFARELC